MTRVLTGLFDDYATAAKAVQELENAGVSYRDISVISNAEGHSHIVPMGTTDDGVSGAGAGTAIGAALGGGAGLLAGLGLVTIPGFGPLAAVGWLAAAAGGAAAGAAAGGMTGLLVGAGISDEDAEVYSEGLRKGGTLVVVRIGPEQYDDARAILAQSSAVDMAGHTHIAGKSEQAAIDSKSNGGGPDQGHRGDADRSASPVIEADRVEGTSVYDSNGKHIGVVERLMIDKVSGRVAYVVMSFGGFLGLREGEYFIPWGALAYDTHLQGYRTNITEEQVRSAPDFYRAPDWRWSDPGKERELHKHYGLDYTRR
jgi:sporulation protein YlmC with PRC-barrel domain